MAMSQDTSGVNAPPKHQPFTMAMVGLGKFISCRHCQFAAERRTRICLLNGIPSVARKNSRRSMPAENELPAPVSTSTPQRSSISSASSTSTISSLSAGLMQLRFSGRFSVTQAIWSSNSTRTFFPPGTFSVEVFSVEVWRTFSPFSFAASQRRASLRTAVGYSWTAWDGVARAGKARPRRCPLT